ncbi:MAG: ribonuclease J [Alphaproteobacteria bacterium]|nr:MAG: ribonuclease J [Alphaproteobacteria bacterium]
MASDFDPKNSEVLYVPLGGAGEIGRNMYLYGHAGKWLLVDCGISFAHDGIPGIDLLMSDPEFILERKESLVGMIVTHAHEDHIGAIPYVIEELGCPIYTTRFTAAMIKTKLEETGLNRKVKTHIIESNREFSVGPFDLQFLPLTHSIPDNHSLVIKTKIGTIFHTGDWKFDPTPVIGEPTDFHALHELGERRVMAMICDSTNVFEPGEGGSEQAVRQSLKKIIAEQTGKVAVTLFASNVARLKSVAEAAEAADRHVVLAGRSLHRVYDIATQLGYIKEIPNLIDEEQVGYFPDNKILFLCTGCQGERMSAMDKIAGGMHQHIKLGDGDTVIFSSREIPGNELAIQQIQNRLARLGVHIITADSHFTHVSGHPYRDELTKMYQLIRPRLAIPMHGELRHLLTHQELAQKCGVRDALVVENGEVIRILPDRSEYVGTIPTDVLALDGDQWIRLNSEVFKEKHKFNWNGAMVISVALDKKGQLVTGPEISLMGVVEHDQLDQVTENVADAVEESLNKTSKSERIDDAAMAEKIRIAAQRVVQAVSGKKPLGRVHILRV